MVILFHRITILFSLMVIWLYSIPLRGEWWACFAALPVLILIPSLHWLPTQWSEVSNNHSQFGNFASTLHVFHIHTLNVNTGGHPNTVSLRLVASPSSQVTDGDAFSLLLASSGVCLENEMQSCIWTKDNDHICSPVNKISGELPTPSSDARYLCIQ